MSFLMQTLMRVQLKRLILGEICCGGMCGVR